MPIDDNYLNTIRRLEHDLSNIDLVTAAASCSISLRRIADAVDLLVVANEQVEVVRNVAIELPMNSQLIGEFEKFLKFLKKIIGKK